MSNHRSTAKRLAAFKALGNPHRLAIFERLTRCCPPGTSCEVDPSAAALCVGDLGSGLDIAPSTVSHHLKELARAGLVQTRREGKHVHCWVDPAVLRDLSDFFQAPLAPPDSATKEAPDGH